MVMRVDKGFHPKSGVRMSVIVYRKIIDRQLMIGEQAIRNFILPGWHLCTILILPKGERGGEKSRDHSLEISHLRGCRFYGRRLRLGLHPKLGEQERILIGSLLDPLAQRSSDSVTGARAGAQQNWIGRLI